MISGRPESAGVALRCDRDGRILEVLRNSLNDSAAIRPGLAFAAWVDPECAQQARTLITALVERQAAFDWVLAVPLAGRSEPLHFAGGLTHDGLVVLGARSRSDMTGLCEDLITINNEQSNALRSALKALSLQARRREDGDSALMEELSRVNNELATAQRELARKNAELSRLNAQKNEFLGIAAHDLRNPLDVIAAYGRFLCEEVSGALDAEHRVFLQRIQTSSEYMRNLVDNLLDIARIEAGRLELEPDDCEICRLVENNVALNRVLAAKKDIRIAFEHDAVGRIPVDEVKIEQVLNNLIGNAIKFSAPGGTVAVRVSQAGASVAIEVSDQGPGVRADELEKLFQPFGKTSTQSTSGEKGAGLGLAIVQRIVNGHGGRIEVRTAQGEGATFRVLLPARTPSSKTDARDSVICKDRTS